MFGLDPAKASCYLSWKLLLLNKFVLADNPMLRVSWNSTCCSLSLSIDEVLPGHTLLVMPLTVYWVKALVPSALEIAQAAYNGTVILKHIPQLHREPK